MVHDCGVLITIIAATGGHLVNWVGIEVGKIKRKAMNKLPSRWSDGNAVIAVIAWKNMFSNVENI